MIRAKLAKGGKTVTKSAIPVAEHGEIEFFVLKGDEGLPSADVFTIVNGVLFKLGSRNKLSQAVDRGLFPSKKSALITMLREQAAGSIYGSPQIEKEALGI